MDKIKQHIALVKSKRTSDSNWLSRHKVSTIALCCVLVLFIGVISFVSYYYRDKAAPGTTIANINVSGKTQSQIKDELKSLLQNTRLSLTYNGKSATASASDLGLNIDVDKFASKAARTGRSTVLNPFSRHHFDLSGSYNKNKVLSFVTSNFPELSSNPVNATVQFNKTNNTFVAVPGAAGHSIETKGLFAKIESLLKEPKITNYEVRIDNAQPVISDQSAQDTANYMNQVVRNRIKIVNNGKLLAYPDPADIAGWTKFTINSDTGKYDITYDDAKIKGYVTDFIAGRLANKPVNEKAITDASGNVLRTITPGKVGQELTDPDAIVSGISSALAAGGSGNIEAQTHDAQYKTDGYQAKDNHWVEANLSDYSVTLWDGNNQVYRTTSTSHGKPSSPTITGLFKVVRKVYEKCMPNPPSKEPLCNIHYSTFFESSGYAFHEAWWMSAAKGNMNKGISHGCINMLKEDARRVYDWSTVGTPVWVHY